MHEPMNVKKMPVHVCEERIWKQKVREQSITKLKWCPVSSAQQNIMICGLCTKWWWCIVKQSMNGAGFTTRWQMGGRWLEQLTRCSHYQYFHWISDLSNTDHHLTGVSLKLVAPARLCVRRNFISVIGRCLHHIRLPSHIVLLRILWCSCLQCGWMLTL